MDVRNVFMCREKCKDSQHGIVVGNIPETYSSTLPSVKNSQGNRCLWVGHSELNLPHRVFVVEKIGGRHLYYLQER